MSIMPSYREIIDLLKKGATVEAQEKLMQLRGMALELQEENLQLRQRNAKLEEQLQTKQALVWKPPFYWLGQDNQREGPYCQRCYDVEKCLVRLQSLNGGLWRCFSCKSVYHDETYRPYRSDPGRGESWMSW